jgi:threonine/homoserine/homoserine lactone efflux protein
MNWELFTTFLLITIVLILVPGPVVTLVIATGANHGIRAGLTTVAGTSLGTGLLLAAIALGLSWILKNAVELFEALRWLGVAYLLWLGIQTWRNASNSTSISPLRGRVHFWRGVGVALTNPKTIAFFTAFLPQFIDPTLMAWAADSSWAIAAGLGRAYFTKSSRAKIFGRMSGATLIGGGIWLALSRRAN